MLIQLSRTSPTKGYSTHSVLQSVIPISPLTTTTFTSAGNADGCLLGATGYTTCQHDIRIRVDDVQEYCIIVIGMSSNTDLPLDKDSHSPGLSAWDGDDTYHIIPSGGELLDGSDVGQCWKNGDILHLHLDCQQHTLSAHHERTGKTHTSHDVIG